MPRGDRDSAPKWMRKREEEMREERLAVGGAIITAFVASLCCIGPLLFVVLGLGAFGAAATFETARPYLLGLAVLLLAFGFYRGVLPTRRGVCFR